MIRRTTATLAVGCLLATGAAAQDSNNGSTRRDNGDAGIRAEYSTSNDTDPAAIAEEIEIMRRVLVRSLLASDLDNKSMDALTQFQRAAAKQSFYHTHSGATASNGFYLPGVGVIYSMQVRVKTRNVVEQPKDGEADAWEAAKRSLDGSSTGLIEAHLTRGARTRRVIDEASVDRAVDTLLRVLAKHAVRMEHLSDSESIVLALQLKPDRRGRKSYKTRLVLRLQKRDLINASADRRAPELRKLARELRY